MSSQRGGAAKRTSGVAAVAVLALMSAPAAALSTHHTSGGWADVIVSGQAGALQRVTDAVRSAGGTVTHTLRVIDGVSAHVPAASVPGLRTTPGVRAVTTDAHGHLMGVDPTLGYDVANDEGSLYDVAQITHAKDSWSHGYTGKGVTVALIDSGVSPVKGLTSGNVVNGPDLSFDSQNANLTNLDGYGHGTHMASIIVGRDQAATGSTYANQSSHQYVGIAPDATLLSLKVGAADGAADVSQVLAAIDWVTEHAASSNIKVLNLSYGTDSAQSPSVDPLDYAVENAWRAGITVVVSAGNDGSNRGVLADPANDPLVIAVGADDPNNSDSIGDDSIASFSQVGPTTGRHIDVLAPGVHILGLRDPGSVIDQGNSSAVVNNRFFRGSGTSQAAAVTSGLVADFLSKYPNATPDQVKAALMAVAQVPNQVKNAGSTIGVPDVNKAEGNKLPTAVQAPTGATGTGSLESARGTSHVSDGTTTLTGETDIFGQAWNPQTWAAASASGTAWNGGTFNGTSWTGTSWTGTSWTSATWSSATWSSATWSGTSWTGHTWTDAQWNGTSWTGTTWTGTTWSSATWSSATWSSATWSSATWSSATWSDYAWA
jgi:serine protease AprX